MPPLPPVPSSVGSPRPLDAGGNLPPPTFPTLFPWTPPSAGPIDCGLSLPPALNLDQLIIGLQQLQFNPNPAVSLASGASIPTFPTSVSITNIILLTNIILVPLDKIDDYLN